MREDMSCKNKKRRLIYRFFKGAKIYFIVAVIASLLTTFLNVLIPQIFKFSIDTVFTGEGYFYLMQNLWIIAMLVIVIAVLSGFFLYLSRLHTAKAGETFAKNIRDALFAHVQRLPMKWHDRNQTGDIIQRCTSDVEVIRNFVVTQLLEIFRTIFLIVTSFTMMAAMNLKLSLIVLCFVPVVVIYSAVFYRLIAKKFTAADEAEGELSTIVQENATGVRVVRAFGREQFEMERFQKKNKIFAQLWIKLGTLSGLYWGVGDLITGLQVVTIIVVGAIEAVHGTISVGEYIAFASYNTTLVWPIRGLGRILSDMSKAGVSFERVEYILNAKEERYGAQDENKITSFDISFEQVTFGYEEEKEMLRKVNFEIAEGSTFGILGGTGSGKSTVIQLLTRLYELEEKNGKIRIGGVDIRQISIERLRKNVGMVLQEPFLYSKTIRENIAVFRPDASLEEIREAAKIACIDDTIMRFPHGYETLVGERGVTLSGGQRQRVAVARMLLQKAPIMIFDDSLSAVDAQTDFEIRRALKTCMKDATVIIISHRIATLMGTDRIMVLNQGQIAELGTHQELVKNGGIYQQIYEIQMNYDDREQVEVNGYGSI